MEKDSGKQKFHNISSEGYPEVNITTKSNYFSMSSSISQF
ncbi:hypothetical protein SynPROSU1_02994 [Synechococcus sp. PROS-U-1]|nr:hypothetical protein SynPROSU1_02994 [Synechococcus sp. PROS-U-1]